MLDRSMAPMNSNRSPVFSSPSNSSMLLPDVIVSLWPIAVTHQNNSTEFESIPKFSETTTLTLCTPTSNSDDIRGEANSTTSGPTESTKIHCTASVGLVKSIPCSGMQSILQVIACWPEVTGAVVAAVNKPSTANAGVLTPFILTSISQSNCGLSPVWKNINSPDNSILDPGVTRAPVSVNAPFSTQRDRLLGITISEENRHRFCGKLASP